MPRSKRWSSVSSRHPHSLWMTASRTGNHHARAIPCGCPGGLGGSWGEAQNNTPDHTFVSLRDYRYKVILLVDQTYAFDVNETQDYIQKREKNENNEQGHQYER